MAPNIGNAIAEVALDNTWTCSRQSCTTSAVCSAVRTHLPAGRSRQYHVRRPGAGRASPPRSEQCKLEVTTGAGTHAAVRMGGEGDSFSMALGKTEDHALLGLFPFPAGEGLNSPLATHEPSSPRLYRPL